MIQDEIDLFPLQAVRVRSNGKRDYEPAAKRRLIEFCLPSGASVSDTALKAGINANQLRKWIRSTEIQRRREVRCRHSCRLSSRLWIRGQSRHLQRLWCRVMKQHQRLAIRHRSKRNRWRS
ncbi:transposase [Cupriavidus sp. UYPR2.512]|uniref:transposase n=1 Tax=Cupriavidus sp. UYPR2.512 TaxID=1080187 RepID=UPI001E4AF475|nr:transposase [Cupriavidus sp. UYPR2.512]